ncbi:MAG: biotin/lipoyl-containing protein, partial [Candidatus Tumulicola sp.]
AAVLADGVAPWRIGGVGMPLRLAHPDSAIANVIADATAEPNVWQLSGEYAGTLQATRYGDAVRATFDGNPFGGSVGYREGEIVAQVDGGTHAFRFADPPATGSATAAHGAAGGDARVTAPMPGKIVKVAVRQGDAVEERALLLVLEAMKMEHRIEASAGARVKAVLVKEGDIVAGGTPLVELE